jgi:hypothetical protein
MLRRALLCAAVVTLAVATPAFASPRSDDHRHHDAHSRSDFRGDRGDRYDSEDDSDNNGSDGSDSAEDDGGDSGSTDTGTGVTVPEVGVQASLGGTLSTGTQRSITASLSGYSFQDNTPAGSAIISMPVIHSKAGGTGTFADPITTAVPGSSGSPETPKGTRIYVARLKRYFVVEDSGATKESVLHFDLYVGGEGFSKSASDKCMNSYTAKLPVIINPAAGLPVTVGALTGPNGCVI